MNAPRTPIGEDDLEALVDGRLAPERRAHVEAYLAEHPEVAARVDADRRCRAELREKLQGKFDEPIPSRLRVAGLRAAQRSRTVGRMRAAVAAAVIFLAGSGSGWLLGHAETGAPARPPAMIVAADADAAYRTFVVERVHPVEVGASQEEHLMQWLSKRVGRKLTAPDLGAYGYQLMGGRLLPGTGGAAAQLMYQDPQGKRLTLYVQAADGGETAFRIEESGGATTCAWIDGGFGFAVTAPASRAEILPIAEAIYHRFEANGPAMRDG